MVLGLALPCACRPASRMFQARLASISGAASRGPRFGSIPQSSYSPCCSSRRPASETITARCIEILFTPLLMIKWARQGGARPWHGSTSHSSPPFVRDRLLRPLRDDLHHATLV